MALRHNFCTQRSRQCRTAVQLKQASQWFVRMMHAWMAGGCEAQGAAAAQLAAHARTASLPQTSGFVESWKAANNNTLSFVTVLEVRMGLLCCGQSPPYRGQSAAGTCYSGVFKPNSCNPARHPPLPPQAGHNAPNFKPAKMRQLMRAFVNNNLKVLK